MFAKLGLSDLMRESETALWQASQQRTDRRARAATWVTSDFSILELWRIRHAQLMRPVASAAQRFGQPARLRAVGVRLVERAALVDYLRDRQISGAIRDRIIARLRNNDNPRRALLDEHREYVLAVSSALCVEHLLHYLSDPMGPRLLHRYQALYVEHFESFYEQLSAEEREAASSSDELALPLEAMHLKRVLMASA